jgi:hypothetical protein
MSTIVGTPGLETVTNAMRLKRISPFAIILDPMEEKQVGKAWWLKF